MLPNEKKKQMRLSVISMLRENGVPMRMSDENEDEEDTEDKELLLASGDEDAETNPPESQKKKKEKEKEEAEKRPPNLNPAGVKSIKDAFRRSKL